MATKAKSTGAKKAAKKTGAKKGRAKAMKASSSSTKKAPAKEARRQGIEGQEEQLGATRENPALLIECGLYFAVMANGAPWLTPSFHFPFGPHWRQPTVCPRCMPFAKS